MGSYLQLRVNILQVPIEALASQFLPLLFSLGHIPTVVASLLLCKGELVEGLEPIQPDVGHSPGVAGRRLVGAWNANV